MDKDMLMAERAAQWLLRLETASAKEREEFWSWLKQSPDHVHEALAAQACHILLKQLLRERGLNARQLLKGSSNARELPGKYETALGAANAASVEGRKSRRRRARRLASVVIAAFIMAALAVATFAFQSTSNGRVDTGYGDWQTTQPGEPDMLSAGYPST